jgi:hypothetical protein
MQVLAHGAALLLMMSIVEFVLTKGMPLSGKTMRHGAGTHGGLSVRRRTDGGADRSCVVTRMPRFAYGCAHPPVAKN